MMLSTSTRALVARGRVSVPSIQTLMRHCTSSTGTTSRRSSSTTTTTDTANKDTSHELLPHRGKELIRTRLRRLEVIHDPSINRGTAFSADERERLGLRGLVPPRRQYLDQQVMRIMKAFDAMSTPLDRRTRGMYFSLEDRGHFMSMVYNWPEDDIDVIVVTDGSRVLGLGDLGANSANIPIGKLALYVAGGGLNPRRTLPVVIDAGTDNEELRNNELYLGVPAPRLKGKEYFELLDEWMDAVRSRWPKVLIQFEDFNNATAFPLLEKYRHSELCFNDDIQSTGCIATAAVLASLKTRRLEPADVKNERIVCLGAGSAGLGVCETIVRAMIHAGADEKDARKRFCLVDDRGVLGVGRQGMSPGQLSFATSEVQDGASLLDAVRSFKPTVLLGLSGVGGLFTEDVVREMARLNKQPVIFPLSNPSMNSECSAEDAFKWTNGTAVFASGSPFDDVTLADGTKGLTNQCNNVYNFPGMGLAITQLRITRVTDEMFHSAAVRISELAGEKQLRAGRLFPPVEDLRAVSAEVAAAVATVALEQGLATEPPPAHVRDHDDLVEYMRTRMWEPNYGTLVAD